MPSPYAQNYREIEWLPLPPRQEPEQIPVARSHLPCPRLVRDEMPPVRSQATGKIYDSKSGIRAEYRQLGLIEVGNDPQRLKPRERTKPDRRAIKASLERAEARFRRGERAK